MVDLNPGFSFKFHANLVAIKIRIKKLFFEKIGSTLPAMLARTSPVPVSILFFSNNMINVCECYCGARVELGFYPDFEGRIGVI